MTAPDWSWLGLVLMLLLLVALMGFLEYVRVAGRCCRSAGKREDEVVQLIEAIGFKVSRACIKRAGFTGPDVVGCPQMVLKRCLMLCVSPGVLIASAHPTLSCTLLTADGGHLW